MQHILKRIESQCLALPESMAEGLRRPFGLKNR
jgi:hypothetical protein